MNRVRTLVSRAVGTAALFVVLPALALADGGVVTSVISSNFNGTSIAGGNWIWFNANFKYTGPTNTLVTIALENGQIQFSDGNTNYSLPVPDSRIHLDPNAAVASYFFNEALNTWIITVPASFGDDIFVAGLAWQVPAGGLDGGISPVTWTADFSATESPVTIKWKWGAAVYTSFTNDYDTLGVQVIHQGDHAGTPQNYTDFVIGGARGGGGSNFTGSWSGTRSVSLAKPISVEPITWTRVKALYR